MSVQARIKSYMAIAAPITDKGTYYGIRPLIDCRTEIHNWLTAHKVPRATPPGLYHVTLLETDVPDLKAPPLQIKAFKILANRIVLARYGATIALEFKSSTIKARHEQLLELTLAKARTTRQLLVTSSYSPHLALTDAGSSISDYRLAELNKAWNIDLIFGHEFTNELHLSRPHVFAPNPNKDPDKERIMKERAKMARTQDHKDRYR